MECCRQAWIPVHSCGQECIPADRNVFLSAEMEYIPVDRNGFLSPKMDRNAFLSTGMHSCRQECSPVHSCQQECIPVHSCLPCPFPCPQTTPGLAGGRRRRHGHVQQLHERLCMCKCKYNSMMVLNNKCRHVCTHSGQRAWKTDIPGGPRSIL